MDRRLRELERSSTGGDRTRLLRERLRAGALSPERLRLAAALGERSAREALGEPPGGESLAGLLALAAAVGPEGPVHVAATAAREALARHELWLEDALPRVRGALDAVDAWTACPCEPHRLEAVARQEELGPLPRLPRYMLRPRIQVEIAARRALMAAAQADAPARAAAALAAAEAAELALAAVTALGERLRGAPPRRSLALLEARPRLQAWALGEPAPAPPPSVLDLVEAELLTASEEPGDLLRLLRAVRRGEQDPGTLRELLHLGLPAPAALQAIVGEPRDDWLSGLPARGPRARAALAAVLPLSCGEDGRAALIEGVRSLLESRAMGRALVSAHDRAIARGGADAAAGYAVRLCWDGGLAALEGFQAALRRAGVSDEEARARACAAFVSWRLHGRDPLPRALAELEG